MNTNEFRTRLMKVADEYKEIELIDFLKSLLSEVNLKRREDISLEEIVQMFSIAMQNATNTKLADEEKHCYDDCIQPIKNVCILLIEQINDLIEMGSIEELDRMIVFSGYDSLSGKRWYNFELLSYIECMTGWAEGRYESKQEEFIGGWELVMYLLRAGSEYE